MFDYIIGNPPYNKNLVKKKHKCYDEVGDSKLGSHGFMHKSSTILNEDGRMIFILPSNFMVLKSGIKIREHLMDNGKIESIRILDDNPFKGYAMPGSVCIISFKNETPSREICIKRDYKGNEFTTSVVADSFIPLSYGDIGNRILHKVINVAKSNPTKFVRNRPITFEKIKSEKCPVKSLLRINKNTNFVYGYCSEKKDYDDVKVAFSLMNNHESMKQNKKITCSIVKNVNCDRGIVYIISDDNNAKYIKNLIESKLMYLCVLQMQDNVHLTKYNLGSLVPNIDTMDYEKYFSLTDDEIDFVNKFYDII